MSRTRDPELLLLQAAADPTRLAILRQLSADGPTCACDLDGCCDDLSQSTVSHHLKVLREAGWIAGERRGTWIWYSIRPAAAERFAAIADAIRPSTARPAGALAPSSTVQPLAGAGRRPAGERRAAWRQW